MTKLRHRKNQLPFDIVLNILARLPVKSVTRFRCVCKSWDSSITTPYFISTHLNHNKNHGNGCVIHMPSVRDTNPSSNTNRPVCTVALDRPFDRISEIGVPFDFPNACFQIVGSCNGLLCLANYGSSTCANDIYLWNPSIRKFKKLPHTCLRQLRFVKLGFAYHSQNNDYKVVRISFSSFFLALALPLSLPLPLPLPEVEVYTLSSDSWRRVGIEFTTSVVNCPNDLSPAPLVSGALHWLAFVVEGEENRKGKNMILSFDVNSEKFGKLELPNGSANTLQRCLSSFKGKLSFITSEHSEQPGFQFSIWALREYGVVESWNKLFVVPSERVACWISLIDYGSLMVCYRNDPGERQGFKHALIDIETLQEKKDPDIQHPSYITTFMESLVLLDGTNVESY
ncbi:F-box/kelch-repeat protein At3g23880-like [Quercus lobata]|nr:F-box/kelch-repeat protein At3g23880-like [Quercus lobata]